MNCLVTGASGFIGSNLVFALNERGHRVKALLRPGADTRALEGADFEAAHGDVTDRAAVARAMRGCDWCFHVAGSYHLWLRDYAPMYRTNVEGTRVVLEAAAEAGCARIVHTSSASCIEPCRNNGHPPVAADETAPMAATRLFTHYKRSKWLAELVAREMAARGAPVVIVNPCAPAGPRDAKPTPTGRMILDFLNRRMPAYMDTGLNWVHVRDVAVGHILAAERGRVGERYLLGHVEGNWTMQQTLVELAAMSGLEAPRWCVPYGAAFVAACLNELFSRVTGWPPKAPLAGVRMARSKMFYSPAKAARELGLPQTPPREALREAMEWFREHGYVRTSGAVAGDGSR